VLNHLDIARLPHRQYIHRGSRRNFHQDSSKAIKSFWSTSRCPLRNTARFFDQIALASLTRSANATVKHNNSAVNFGLLNIRSLTSKGQLIQDLLADRKLDFLCLTETWQQPNDLSQLHESTPPGFVYISCPHGNAQWKVLPVSVPAFSSFECTVFKLPGPTPTIISTVYRPPKPHSDFLSDFSTLLTHLSLLSPNVILLGDFNIHMDNSNSPLTRDFSSCLHSFGFQQYSNFSTHILDLICCSGVTPSNCSSDELNVTNHFFLSFNFVLSLSSQTAPHLISEYQEH